MNKIPHQFHRYFRGCSNSLSVLRCDTRAVQVLLSGLIATAASQAAALSLEEVVITASRAEQRILDSSATLSVVSEQDLLRSTAYFLAETLRDVPGVQVSDAGQAGLARIRIRGEESRRTTVLINSQEVTDHSEVGAPLTLHPAMLERVEVMRGSGAVLYGSRALSGVVNFIPRRGGTEPIQLTLSGSYNGATSGEDLFASVYGRTNDWDYRLAYADADHEDRNSPQGDIENTSFETENYYVYLGRRFGAHNIELTWEDYQSSSHIFVEEEVRNNPPLTDFYLETPRRDREKYALFYYGDIEGELLKSVESNVYRQLSYRHFYTRTELETFERDINSFSKLTTDGALVQFELQPIAHTHHVLVGFQYASDSVDQTRRVDTLSLAPPIPSGSDKIDDEAAIDTWAWFAQDEWQINDAITLTTGIRQYFIDGELSKTTRTSLTPGQLDKDDKIVGALGLVWAYNEAGRLRLNIAQGYVYPSLAQLATGAFAGSRFVNPNLELTPETSINYEMGWRYQNATWLADVTAFYTQSDDYIDHLPCTAEDSCPGSRDRLYSNIGESQAHGVELYVAGRENNAGVHPYINFSWTKRRNQYATFSTWDSGVPDISGRLGVRWESQVRGGAFWLDSYVRGESASQVEEPGTVRSVVEDKSSWVTLNTVVGVNLGAEGRYQLVLDLKNLTGETYKPSTENLYGPDQSATLKLTVNW